jgi:hypothetical protein
MRAPHGDPHEASRPAADLALDQRLVIDTPQAR